MQFLAIWFDVLFHVQKVDTSICLVKRNQIITSVGPKLKYLLYTVYVLDLHIDIV